MRCSGISLRSGASLVLLAGAVVADSPPRVTQRAIDPTGTQIGVNQVTVDVPTITYANVVYHSLVSEYMSVSGSDISWKQGDTQHITATVTNTDGGKTATITQTAPVAAATKENGDIDIIITPELLAEFKELADSARTAAGCASGLQGRELASCGLSNFIEGIMKADGVIKSADDALSSRPLIKPSDIAKLVSMLKAGGNLVKPKFAAGAGVGAVAVWWYSQSAAGTNDEPLNVIPVLSANANDSGSPTTTGCPPSAPTGKEAPICEEPNCVGEEANICTTGEWKDCKCINIMHPVYEDLNKDTLDKQQEVISAMVVPTSTKPAEPKATCSPNSNPYVDPIAMDIPFAKNLAGVFCKGDTSKAMKADLTNKDISTNNKRSLLEERTPPPTSSGFEGYKFHFEYTPGEGKCQKDCNDAMGALISGCQGIDSHVMQPAGTMTLDCGAKYSYSISSPPKPTTAAPEPTGPDGRSKKENKACRADKVPSSPQFKRDDAIKAINDLCKNELKGNKNGCIQSKGSGSTPIFVKAAFTSDRGGSCAAYPFSMVDDEYSYKDEFEAMCKWALQSAVDDCDIGTTKDNMKLGGSNRANCIEYTIYAYKKDDGVPTGDRCAWDR
ncbi:hypothetical protein GTA08_BOTSDO07479 [Neofusicoccum parvum]|uniref:Uncharacterized protein n=1 Tax=Neofusicoccum parvum TaxID=310453 RepID=A0ACB5SQ20_9PEZI|nr:hypothetical protein GTA08_BOTSDO07479 [Neofusicoccum parvum]